MIVVYITNKLFPSVLNNITPYDVLHSSKPKYSKLRIFGCLMVLLESMTSFLKDKKDTSSWNWWIILSLWVRMLNSMNIFTHIKCSILKQPNKHLYKWMLMILTSQTGLNNLKLTTDPLHKTLKLIIPVLLTLKLPPQNLYHYTIHQRARPPSLALYEFYTSHPTPTQPPMKINPVTIASTSSNFSCFLT